MNTEDHKEKPYIILDIETDDLKATKIHFVCVKDSHLKTVKCFDNTQRDEFKVWMDKRPNHLLVGHNLRKFDLPMINILWKQTHRQNIVDTLILSRDLGYIAGGHSLAVWADF